MEIKHNLVTSKHFSPGFTLIELLVVIAIIGLLASVVLLALNSARQKSRDAKRVADLNQMAKSFELFFNDAAAYPTASAYTVSGGALLGSAGMSAVSVLGTTYNFTPSYLRGLPLAPTPFDNSGVANCTTANNSYMYEANVTGSTYTISFCLGGSIPGGLTAGTHALTPGGFR